MLSHQQILKYTRFIFNRPILAALLVGSFIHLFSYFNQLLMAGTSSLDSFKSNLNISVIFAFGQILIPYLVPFIVTNIGRKLSQINRKEIMNKFPEMNPDIVIVLDENRMVDYLNPAANNYLKQLSISSHEINKLLPQNYYEEIDKYQHQPFTFSQEISIQNMNFSFTFKRRADSPNIFITGRDTTEKSRMSKRLQHVTEIFSHLTHSLDQMFTDYDPFNFDINEHNLRLVKTLLQFNSQYGQLPKQILLANKTNNQFNGHLYYQYENKIIRDDDTIIIPTGKNAEHYAIMEGTDTVKFSNWEEECEDLASFQQRFHPKVRERIGTIERFITYQSGDIAVIGFYQGDIVDELDADVLKTFTILSNTLKRISDQSMETEKAFIYTMDALARAAEANDEDTGEHIVRLNEYSKLIAKTLKLGDEFISSIHASAQMHDVGKIHVHPDILKKPGKLTDVEFSKMKAHPAYGAKILGESPRLKMAADIAFNHHEKFNGTGYPRGIAGNDIPISARIVSIADVYDALRQKRSYKPAFSHEKSVAIITQGDGRVEPEHFDPKVLQAFVSVNEKMDEIFEKYRVTS